ncbi:MAG: ATP-binding cassette domain-containing protein, partial [Actinomycetota bacterium]
ICHASGAFAASSEDERAVRWAMEECLCWELRDRDVQTLSGGERQLVALARAQIASPGLLILDEATSAVDPGAERRINEALRRLSAGRTVVTIAHRLSTAEHAENVFVFDAGRLVEEGTHAELVARCGVYAGLHESWLGNTRAAEAERPAAG